MKVLPPIALKNGSFVQWFGALLLALATVLGTIRMLRPQMDERLYARFRALPTAQFQINGDTVLSAACTAFNLKQYTKARPLFDAYSSGPYTDHARFFGALCLLEHNKMKEAEAVLSNLDEAEQSLKDESIWYHALSQLRRHDRKGCLLSLQRLSPQSPRWEMYQKLMEKLGL
jgi:hypothetical protein